MGLDTYSKRIKTKYFESTEVDFQVDDGLACIEVEYWRNHDKLQEWLKDLYLEKGGTDENFNCSTVVVNEEDLQQLEKLDWLDEKDKDFIQEARNQIKNGWTIYFISWY